MISFAIAAISDVENAAIIVLDQWIDLNLRSERRPVKLVFHLLDVTRLNSNVSEQFESSLVVARFEILVLTILLLAIFVRCQRVGRIVNGVELLVVTEGIDWVPALCTAHVELITTADKLLG